MIYEGQIQYIAIDKNGNDKSTKASYIIENAELFADAEEALYVKFQDYTDIDIIAVKRSKVKEIANTRQSEDDKIWLAEMQDVFVEDDGSERAIKYKVLFFSKTYDSANAFISNYAKQGYNLELVSLKLTKFDDVLK